MTNLLSKYISSVLCILMLVFANGCGKNPINGDLDGQWQVMDIVPEAPETSVQGRLYMCFNLHVCQLTSYGSGAQAAGNLKFDSQNNTLSLDFPDIQSERGLNILKQYGIYSNPVTFEIEMLNSSNLILRDGDVLVVLRKF